MKFDGTFNLSSYQSVAVMKARIEGDAATVATAEVCDTVEKCYPVIAELMLGMWNE